MGLVQVAITGVLRMLGSPTMAPQRRGCSVQVVSRALGCRHHSSLMAAAQVVRRYR
jgi:hypothetical protein